MVKARAFAALLIATTLTGSAMAASAGTRALPRTTGNSVILADHVTRIDATSSTIRGMGHRLIFALWTLRSMGLVDLSNLGGAYELDMTDGPDSTDPLGAKDKGLHGQTIPPTTSNTPR